MTRVSVCEGSACRALGSEAVWAAARRWHAELGLAPICALARGGCYGLCARGPTVFVRPETPQLAYLTEEGDYARLGTPGEVHHPEVDPLKMARILHGLINQH